MILALRSRSIFTILMIRNGRRILVSGVCPRKKTHDNKFPFSSHTRNGWIKSKVYSEIMKIVLSLSYCSAYQPSQATSSAVVCRLSRLLASCTENKSNSPTQSCHSNGGEYQVPKPEGTCTVPLLPGSARLASNWLECRRVLPEINRAFLDNLKRFGQASVKNWLVATRCMGRWSSISSKPISTSFIVRKQKTAILIDG